MRSTATAKFLEEQRQTHHGGNNPTSPLEVQCVLHSTNLELLAFFWYFLCHISIYIYIHM